MILVSLVILVNLVILVIQVHLVNMVNMEKLVIWLNLFFSRDNTDHGHLDEFGEYSKTIDLGDSCEYGDSGDSG